MKQFTKVCLGFAGFFASVAVVCIVIAFVMGFSIMDFPRMIKDGKFSIQMGDGQVKLFGYTGKEIFEIDVNEDETDSDTVVYENLSIDFGAGKLEIYYDDVETIQVEKSGVVGFEMETDEESKTLHIEGGMDVGVELDSTLSIILPKNYRFKTVDLEVGAGQAVAKDLLVDNLDVETGVGQVDIEIAGSKEDYSYDVECGIGNVEIGGKSFGGFGADQSVEQDDTDRMIDVECGIGEVIINFTE